VFTTGAVKKAYATFVFIEELDPRGYEINSFMVNHYPSNNWTDVPGNMHINAGIISFRRRSRADLAVVRSADVHEPADRDEHSEQP